MLDLACQLSSVTDDVSAEGLRPVLRGLAEAGYQRAVLPPLDPRTADVQALGTAFSEAGLVPVAMAGHAVGADVGSPYPAERAAGAAHLRNVIDTAVRLGADHVTGVPYGCPGVPGPIDQRTFELSARAVGEAADHAHERGVVLSFEVLNRYETAIVNTAEDAVRFVEASGSAHLRIHLDTFHMAIEEADTSAAIRTALPWLAYLEIGQSGRGPLGSGSVDVTRIVGQALDDGYTGRWGVEAFSRDVAPGRAADRLAIWRTVYSDGVEMAAAARRVVERGWANSTVGRRARRESRSAAPTG